MALQTSGPIAGSDVNEELGRSASAQFNLGGSEERELADILSGAISLSDFYGAASMPSVTFVNSSNRTGANIYSLMGSPTEPGLYTFDNRATISGGDSGFALRTGVFPAGSILVIVNRGYILGKGGNAYMVLNDSLNGRPGGHGLYLDMDCQIENAEGYIRGSGGGGGSIYKTEPYKEQSGYGGGGGAGTPAGSGVSATPPYGAPGGTYTLIRSGAAGTATSGGAGSKVLYDPADGSADYYYEAGAGGAPGASGEKGHYLQGSTKNYTPKSGTGFGVGGAGGKAILTRGFNCTILSGNNSTRISGGIS